MHLKENFVRYTRRFSHENVDCDVKFNVFFSKLNLTNEFDRVK